MDQQPHELKKADTVGTESSLESNGRGSIGNESASSEFDDVEEGIIANHEEEDVIIPAAHHQRRMNTVILLSILPLAAALIALGVLLSSSTQSASIVSSATVQPSNMNTTEPISSTAPSPSETEIIIIETISNIENTQSKLPPNEVRDRVVVIGYFPCFLLSDNSCLVACGYISYDYELK